VSLHIITLTLCVDAPSNGDAFDIGKAAAEHLLTTFNDDNSLGNHIEVEAKPQEMHS
jgi:hypothetical protein